MKIEAEDKIIADTGIWIEFLKNNQDLFFIMQEFLENKNIIAIGCVFGELLQGVKSEREKEIILNYWEYLPKIDETNIWIEAGNYSNKNKLLEKGIGLIDSILITISEKNNFKLWTLDKKLRNALNPDLIYL